MPLYLKILLKMLFCKAQTGCSEKEWIVPAKMDHLNSGNVYFSNVDCIGLPKSCI
jgi:hypothetical protein